MLPKIAHHQATKNSEIAITTRVGVGRLAPKLANTDLKAGTTQIMMTAVTMKAIARIDTGYISADLILALMARVFSL